MHIAIIWQRFLPYHWARIRHASRKVKELLPRTYTGHKSKGLNDYVALWHRMRASIYIRLGRRWSALKEIQKAAYFSRVNLKLFAYSVLAVLPKRLFINLLEFRQHSFRKSMLVLWQIFL